MGHSPSSTPARPWRTLGLIVVVAATLVLSGGSAAWTTGHAGAAPSHSQGGAHFGPGAELSAARESLSHRLGPAAGHPSVQPSSPGGYTWTNISGLLSSAPSGRLATMAWDGSDGYVLLFGWESLSGYLRDTWSYANGNWTNLTSSVGTPPTAASYTMMAFDPSIQKVVYYSPLNNTTWTYHDRVWTNITASAGHPDPAIDATMTTDTSDNEVVFVGGLLLWGSGWSHNTWVIQNGTWRNVTSTAPFNFGRIIVPSLADDPTDHGVVAQGLAEWQNTTPILYKPATFVFSSDHWTNLTPSLTTEPAMGELYGFAWLGTISADVMQLALVINSSGGIGYRSGVTWEFAHDTWTNVTAVTGPQPDTGILTQAVADPTDGTIVMFGGERLFAPPVVYPGTWLFSAPPTVGASASKSVIDSGQSVSFTGTSTGGASPVTYRWNFGDGGNSTALSGSHSYSRTGVVTATLTATDLVGHVSSAAVSLYVNPSLTLSANATPASPVNGSWVAFSSLVTGGSAPFTYSWNLGDGTTSTAPSLGHAYSRTGTFTVSLNVTDAAGVTQSTSFSVTVKAVSSSSSSSSGSVSLSSGTGLYLLLGIVLLLVVVVLLAAMLARRPRSPPGTLQPYATASPTPPAGATPPPGAGGPPGQ